MVKIILNGYLGAMGRVITSLAEDRKNGVEIAAGIDIAEPKVPAPFPVYRDISLCDIPADAVLEVSYPLVVPAVVDYALKTRTNAVICTTGLNDEINAKIDKASESIAVFRSANMSLGIGLLGSLIKQAAALLYEEGFDIEIIEKHHNKKTDAPSGTALMLADTVNGALDNRLEYIYSRNAVREERGRERLGIHALRGGTIVGEHSVIFAGLDEVIEIKHSALSKNLFGVGMLKAARFIAGKPPGLYSMDDMMPK